MVVFSSPEPTLSIVPNPEEWPERFGDILYRFAIARGAHVEQAPDLVQETFLVGIQRLKSFRGESSLLTWLASILKHKLLDLGRAKRRSTRRLDKKCGDPFDDEGWWDQEPGRWDPPDAPMEREEFWATLRGCLGDLPPTLAEAFAIRELDGMSCDEACSQLAISSTNLWSRLYRARLLLRACLELRWFGGDIEEVVKR